MSTKLTHSEHHARAMLMGRVYDWRDGTYCVLNETAGFMQSNSMIDCVTLEHITHIRAVERITHASRMYDDIDPPETEWARRDE